MIVVLIFYTDVSRQIMIVALAKCGTAFTNYATNESVDQNIPVDRKLLIIANGRDKTFLASRGFYLCKRHVIIVSSTQLTPSNWRSIDVTMLLLRYVIVT